MTTAQSNEMSDRQINALLADRVWDVCMNMSRGYLLERRWHKDLLFAECALTIVYAFKLLPRYTEARINDLASACIFEEELHRGLFPEPSDGQSRSSSPASQETQLPEDDQFDVQQIQQQTETTLARLEIARNETDDWLYRQIMRLNINDSENENGVFEHIAVEAPANDMFDTADHAEHVGWRFEYGDNHDAESSMSQVRRETPDSLMQSLRYIVQRSGAPVLIPLRNVPGENEPVTGGGGGNDGGNHQNVFETRCMLTYIAENIANGTANRRLQSFSRDERIRLAALMQHLYEWHNHAVVKIELQSVEFSMRTLSFLVVCAGILPEFLPQLMESIDQQNACYVCMDDSPDEIVEGVVLAGDGPDLNGDMPVVHLHRLEETNSDDSNDGNDSNDTNDQPTD
jgi:hypothetical protein